MDREPPRPRSHPLPPLHLPTVGGLALAIVALHLAVVGDYGIFRDEFCLGTWLVLVALQDGSRWPWLAFGGVAGLGLLAKHSMAVFGLGIFPTGSGGPAPATARP